MTVSWLIGSIRLATDQAFVTSAGNATVSAGIYYLRSETVSESLIDAMETALNDAGVSTPSVFVDESGHVQMTGGAFSVTWGSATALRDALGFQSNLGSSVSHVAPNLSTILWSPRFPANPMTRQGIDAYEVPDIAQTISPTGQTVVTTLHHTKLKQTLKWGFVGVDQLQDARPSSPGTFHRFLQEVIRANQAFYHADGVAEVIGGSAAVAWPITHGPYKAENIAALDRWYSRRIEYADIGGPITLNLLKTEGA